MFVQFFYTAFFFYKSKTDSISLFEYTEIIFAYRAFPKELKDFMLKRF